VDTRAPRVVWWDGLDLGDLPILDDLRGLGIGTVRFGWENSGNYSDEVDSTVVLESSLTGKEVARLDVEDAIVLRGSTRSFATSWFDYIPLVGRFEPTIEVQRSNGESVTKKLPAIWVIPSWWYIIALLLAIALPVWWRRRSGRRYRELETRLAASEARQSELVDHDEWSEDQR